MQNFKTMLRGKKTYVVALILVLVGVAQWAGIDIPGIGEIEPLELILNGLGLSALRAGIK